MRQIFEHRHQKPIPLKLFIVRQGKYLISSVVFLGIGLGIGILGYHELENMTWLDSFLNAAMILGGMGPVDVLHTQGGKIFAGLYALFSGLMFLIAAGLLFGPLIHRIFHHFHFQDEDGVN